MKFQIIILFLLQVSCGFSGKINKCSLVSKDIIFILDNSYLVSSNQFKLAKQFVSRIANFVDVVNPDNRIAFISFGNEPNLILKLNKYNEIGGRIEGSNVKQYKGSVVSIGKTLKFTLEQVSTEMRKEAKKIIILITHGVSNVDHQPEAFAERLKDKSIEITIIGVGKHINATQLKEISSLNTIIEIKGTEELKNIEENVKSDICSKKTFKCVKSNVIINEKCVNNRRDTILIEYKYLDGKCTEQRKTIKSTGCTNDFECPENVLGGNYCQNGTVVLANTNFKKVADTCLVLDLSTKLGTKCNDEKERYSECLESKQDLVILLDSSDSVNRTGFQIAKVFLGDLIYELTEKDNGIRISFIRFSEEIKIDYTFLTNSDEQLFLIDEMQKFGSERAIGVALNATLQKLYPQRRLEVPFNILLITDGHNTIGPEPKQFSNDLKSLGVNIFSIGIGHEIDKNEMTEISSKNGTFFVESYKNLYSQLITFVKTFLCRNNKLIE